MSTNPRKKPRNRIVRHVRVRAGDLVAHELNPRVHSGAQRAALAALYDDIGFARSLLAYELPDGRLKLIDGHLRASMDPEQEVEVEVLDVTDAEARALLLAIDPLAQLAGYEADTLAELRRITEPDCAALQSLWDILEQASRQTLDYLNRPPPELPPEQYLIVIECEGEQDQLALLERLQNEGLRCQAKIA